VAPAAQDDKTRNTPPHQRLNIVSLSTLLKEFLHHG
jgi:hypothetical protein